MKWPAKYLALSLVMLSVATAGISIKSGRLGTVVYCKRLKDEIVVAADSRGSWGNSRRDDECKITTYRNRGFFASAGNVRINGKQANGQQFVWDSHALAREAFKYAESQKDGQSKAWLAATFWRDRGKKFFQTTFANDPKALLELSRSDNSFGGICEGIFASNDGGVFSLNHVQIRLKKRESKTPTIEAEIDGTILEGQYAAMGHGYLIKEFESLASDRAQSAWLKWQNSLPSGLTATRRQELLAIQLIRWAIDFRDTKKIGGDVNAVALDQNGVRWLRQAPYCKANEQ